MNHVCAFPRLAILVSSADDHAPPRLIGGRAIADDPLVAPRAVTPPPYAFAVAVAAADGRPLAGRVDQDMLAARRETARTRFHTACAEAMFIASARERQAGQLSDALARVDALMENLDACGSPAEPLDAVSRESLALTQQYGLALCNLLKLDEAHVQWLQGARRTASGSAPAAADDSTIAAGPWHHFDRARCFVSGASGEALLLDTSDPAQTVRHLRELTGDNTALLMAVLQLPREIEQTVEAAMRSHDSPVGLGGQRGLLAGHPDITIRLRADGEGGLLADCFLAIADATHFIPADSPQHPGIPLLRSSVANFTFARALSPRAEATTIEALDCMFRAAADPWSASYGKNYRKPQHPDDLFGSPQAAQLRRDLRPYCTTDAAHRDLAFLDDVQAFEATPDPTLEMAREINDALGAEAAIRGWEQLPNDARRTYFQEARWEVQQRVLVETVPAFLSELS